MKNFWKNKKGFVRNLTLIIIGVIIGLSVYIWGGHFLRIAGPLIENSKKDGILFQIIGIKGGVMRVLEKKENRTERAMELVEGTKDISDQSGSYVLKIPQSWKITANEGAKEFQISRLIVQNSSFSMNSKNGINYFNQGAQLSVSITKRESDASHKQIDGKKEIFVGGQKLFYHIFKEANAPNAQFLDVHVEYKNNTITFQFIYNPKNFSDGEFTFQEILNSVEFQ